MFYIDFRYEGLPADILLIPAYILLIPAYMKRNSVASDADVAASPSDLIASACPPKRGLAVYRSAGSLTVWNALENPPILSWRRELKWSKHLFLLFYCSELPRRESRSETSHENSMEIDDPLKIW